MNADSINPVYGVEDKFYNPGSDIQLSCVIRRVSGGTVWLKVHTNIMWIKDGNVIDLHKRHSVSVGTQVEAEKIISTLLVKEAMLSDSGKYSCSLPHLASSYFPRAAVMVHVIQGDHQAVYGAASLTNSSRFIYLLYGYLLCCRRQFLMNA
ncbi:uncharacterized protein LOC111715028 [Eurytemora carolleeae]|uniref:uncharacterized protein LOC111715028 n=1 Tax=Eurytemora carolleeae TaxID=1294199 RepID=UPI000C772D0B|nr:uncharacterized protein LOC111715028 [Eurytemora carolleeae]|eukprot:XP_023346031.1 uncharacterized protein LOC111715028 [Eurytemora affinis]